jgi:putative SOS response-associated peptidase YedK
MCGRFTHMYSWRELHQLYSQCGVRIAEPDASLFAPSYNVAPTQMVPVVRLDDTGNGYISALKWGLVPSWADDPSIGSRMINARCEEAAAKPAYREPLKKRRCLIPASGFYEWQGVMRSKAKQPWYFTVTGEPVFSFAGLWERWEKGGEPVESFTLLTGAANELVKPIHDRMPCIVAPEQHARWLDPGIVDVAALGPALSPYPSESMAAWRVSSRVGSPGNNDASLVERAA